VYYLRASVYFFTFVNNKKNIDRGKLLKSLVKGRGISITNLVKKVGYRDRASYYSHISKPDLSFDILSAYAKVLNYDLRQDFAEINSFLLEDSTSDHISPVNLEEAVSLLDRWKQKYYLLMEKHLKLLEEKL
jgi:transcriptional regulator with XRE-family HTH domain